MRMNEPSGWANSIDGATAFRELLSRGKAVEVTHLAPKWLTGPVAIENEVFDRFVSWDTEALRRHCFALDDTARLEHLFDVCGCAAYGAGGCFICRAVDAQGYTGRPERQVLTMTNYGRPTEPIWLIHG